MVRKKCIIFFAAATMFSFNIFCGVAEAKTTFFSILGDIVGGVADFVADASKEKHSGSSYVGSGVVIKRGEISLDGSKNKIFTRYAEAGDVVAEQYFLLHEPAEINILMLGKSAFRPVTSIMGKGNVVFATLTAINEEEQRRSIVLGPGGYTVRTVAGDKREVGGLSCELYFSKKDLPFNGIDGVNTRESAVQLMADVPVNDYFSCNSSPEMPVKFYTFDMGYNGNISFLLQKMTDTCNISCTLLNESGEEIYAWDGAGDGQNVRSMYIPAGKYYLRVQQKQADGCAYSLNIR